MHVHSRCRGMPRLRLTGTRGRKISPADGWTCPGKGHTDDDPSIPHHGCSVVTTVGVLAGDRSVVVDQQFHGIRQRDDLRRPLGLDPFAVEGVGKCAYGYEWVTS